jgi:hypothetical protein
MSVHWGGRGPGHLSRWSAAATPSFNPASLFASSEKGLFYDFQNATTLFSDTALTTPATSAIAGVKDLSPNGVNATQATGSRQPTISSFSGYAAALLDGLDDNWSTGSIDFSGTDKLSIFVVARKTSDAAAGVVAELSTNFNTSVGSFGFFTHDISPREWDCGARGSASVASGMYAYDTTVSPDTAVLTTTHDIAGDLSTMRRNGVAATSGTADKGSGNFGNYPLYIGRRGGTTAPYTGYMVALLVIGRLFTATEITNLEKWGAAKCGVTLP